jgi:hypothetical protein
MVIPRAFSSFSRSVLDAGESLDQSGLAVVYVSGGAQDELFHGRMPLSLAWKL